MLGRCLICDKPVIVIGNPEIVSCSNDTCMKTIENHIGLHYQSEDIVALSHKVMHRNDFDHDVEALGL